MKTKVTKKAVRNGFRYVLSVGYCDACHLLYFKRPFAYSTRVEGWACDYYDLGDVCISTGYSPTGKDVDYSILRKYDEKAKKIVSDYSISQKAKENRVELLLNEFLSKVTH